MIWLGVLFAFFALDFAAVFTLDGISHLTSAWPWFLLCVIPLLSFAMIRIVLWADKHDAAS